MGNVEASRCYGRLLTRWRQIACEISFHALSLAESYVTLWLITGMSHPLEAFVLDTVNRIVTIVFKMVPCKVGVDEFGSEIVSRAIGLGPGVGVTLALVRKGRLIVSAAVGLGLLIRRYTRLQSPMPY